MKRTLAHRGHEHSLLTMSFPKCGTGYNIDGVDPLNEKRVDNGEHCGASEPPKDKIASRFNMAAAENSNDRTDETKGCDYGFFPIDDDSQGSDSRQSQEERGCVQQQHELLGCATSKEFAPGEKRPTSRKKSSLRRGSAYGEDEGIPLDFERRGYNRVLPKPDILSSSFTGTGTNTVGDRDVTIRSISRGLFRVSSEPVFVRPVYQGENEDDQDQSEQYVTIEASPSASNFVEGAMKKRISFGTIQFREFTQTIGDNPSCSYGTPVQLDWEYQELEELNVDTYEAYKPAATRTMQQLQLNHFRRLELLQANGYSNDAIKESKRAISKLRSRRYRTAYFAYPPLIAIEDAIESSARKFKRAIGSSNN